MAVIPKNSFQYYVSLGPERSYQKVAEHYGVSKRGVVKHALKESWQSRLLSIEQRAKRRIDKALVEQCEAIQPPRKRVCAKRRLTRTSVNDKNVKALEAELERLRGEIAHLSRLSDNAMEFAKNCEAREKILRTRLGIFEELQ